TDAMYVNLSLAQDTAPQSSEHDNKRRPRRRSDDVQCALRLMGGLILGASSATPPRSLPSLLNAQDLRLSLKRYEQLRIGVRQIKRATNARASASCSSQYMAVLAHQ